MSSDRSISFCRYAVAVDTITDDIMRIRSGTVSEYAMPRRFLAEARGYLISDRKACIKLLRKARAAYIREAELAARYGRVAERIRFSGDARAVTLNQKYVSLLAAGKYPAAAKVLRELERRTVCAAQPISVSARSMSGNSVTLEVRNTSDAEVQVILVRGVCSGQSVTLTPASFALPPFASYTVVCREVTWGQVVELNIEYRVDTADRSLTVPVTLG